MLNTKLSLFVSRSLLSIISTFVYSNQCSGSSFRSKLYMGLFQTDIRLDQTFRRSHAKSWSFLVPSDEYIHTIQRVLQCFVFRFHLLVLWTNASQIFVLSLGDGDSIAAITNIVYSSSHTARHSICVRAYDHVTKNTRAYGD